MKQSDLKLELELDWFVWLTAVRLREVRKMPKV